MLRESRATSVGMVAENSKDWRSAGKALIIFLAVTARKPVENWKCERRRLAGAGLGNAQQILAGQQFGNGACLDRCRLDVVAGGQRTLYGIGQVEA